MYLNNIRRYLLSRLGSRVIIIYNGSRNKRDRYEGIIYRIYNNIFTIINDKNEVKCFSYIDILTKTIQIYF